MLQPRNRPMQLSRRRPHVRRKHRHRLARLAAQHAIEPLCQHRQLGRPAPFTARTGAGPRRPSSNRRRRAARGERPVHRFLRHFSRRSDVLHDQLLDSFAQLFVRVRHARPNRTLARARSTPPLNGYVICADAEHHAFERGSFDSIISRFGVMFFSDSVRAFANLRRAARDGAELCAIVWRSPDENPFMTTAERAAAAILPNIPARKPDAPGQFRFADPDSVRRILEESDWADVDIRPLDVECVFPEKDLVRYVTTLGPLGRILRDADQQTQDRVLAVVRPAFDPYVREANVRFGAACWRVGAKAHSSIEALPGRP
jgi:SAM-dependent methyltransferase